MSPAAHRDLRVRGVFAMRVKHVHGTASAIIIDGRAEQLQLDQNCERQ